MCSNRKRGHGCNNGTLILEETNGTDTALLVVPFDLPFLSSNSVDLMAAPKKEEKR